MSKYKIFEYHIQNESNTENFKVYRIKYKFLWWYIECKFPFLVSNSWRLEIYYEKMYFYSIKDAQEMIDEFLLKDRFFIYKNNFIHKVFKNDFASYPHSLKGLRTLYVNTSKDYNKNTYRSSPMYEYAHTLEEMYKQIDSRKYKTSKKLIN